MNEDKYSSAKEIIKGLNIWSDDKHLLESVVSRAERLEKEVLSKQKTLDKWDRQLMNEKELDDMRMIAYNSYDDFSKYAAAKILQLYDHVEGLKKALDERDREVDQYKYVVEINSKRIEDLQGEILRLRHALKFYANDDNWRGGLRMSSSINCDGGDTARRALEGEKFFECYKSYKYFKVGESE